MTELLDSYTSTGSKLFWHQEAMKNLRNGKGQPIVTHVLCTDVCNHSCAFCSVQARVGDVLPFDDIMAYLDILLPYGLKAVILSGGGNPILYKCKKSGKNFNHLVGDIHDKGLEIGLITNGMPLATYDDYGYEHEHQKPFNLSPRKSWKGISPATLDKCKWIRISMAGLDHDEREVYVPDVDPSKTTLGFSYVFADILSEPADPHHGKVSTVGDLITLNREGLKDWKADDRIEELTEQIGHYVNTYKPSYVRLLPDCLAPNLIPERAATLQKMANKIDPNVVFVQVKPPSAPRSCYLGYVHPVLNCDGYCFPCDSVVLAAAEIGYREGKPNHKFDNPWRMCHWSEIARLYEEPIHTLVDPQKLCNGCVFTDKCNTLDDIVTGVLTPLPMSQEPEHASFV